MGLITYEAKRAIISGHVAGNLYDLESDFQIISPFETVDQTTKTPLNGVDSESTLNSVADGWTIKSGHIVLAFDEDIPLDWNEFRKSVISSEEFTLDVLGTKANPRNPQTVILRPNTRVSFSRLGATNRYTASFSVIVKP